MSYHTDHIGQILHCMMNLGWLSIAWQLAHLSSRSQQALRLLAVSQWCTSSCLRTRLRGRTAATGLQNPDILKLAEVGTNTVVDDCVLDPFDRRCF